MVGLPRCDLDDLGKPQLRKCPFDIDSISWLERLGGGRDGYCWKVKFGDKGPFALKLFWDGKRPDFGEGAFALERECRNAALLQMMEAAIDKGSVVGQPVMVYANPQEWVDAVDNVRSFSTEMHQNPDMLIKHAAEIDMELRPITSVPRLRKCYGWISLRGSMLRDLPGPIRPPPVYVERKLTRRVDYGSDETEHIAIVYEYVKAGENELAKVQETVCLTATRTAATPLRGDDKEVLFLDWQVAHIGTAFHDLAYFVVSMLTVDERRTHGMVVLTRTWQRWHAMTAQH
ncbi:hypothetical protein SPBR_05108 [Sporothrix brasiliensis 5110]|uniref:Protein kinase domain-containing protein n=1 Tax=Sporothrix brasiliensis 5110 TaxID=1398154 RepID=A0A0C2IR64_9PEZI|nr:uncharacterized protein SPBR_05108 [Sporothrix brasiliensis 5110]KIH87517.1 hypothetical protein SPBR_05108 [Sporothrix brasiliensis 5110]